MNYYDHYMNILLTKCLFKISVLGFMSYLDHLSPVRLTYLLNVTSCIWTCLNN